MGGGAHIHTNYTDTFGIFLPEETSSNKFEELSDSDYKTNVLNISAAICTLFANTVLPFVGLYRIYNAYQNQEMGLKCDSEIFRGIVEIVLGPSATLYLIVADVAMTAIRLLSEIEVDFAR